MKHLIVSFGKPGAGKGTRVSEFLQGREEYETLSVGNLLRKARQDQTELGKKAAYYMDSGLLVPDDIINEIVIEGIKHAEKHVITDGFPRTIGQAKAMLEAGIYPNVVVEFYVDDEVVLQRSRDRIVCEKCGEPYTTNEFKRPKQDGICDRCGGMLVRRKDDNEEVVKNRLEVYQSETYPVLDMFAEKGVLITRILNNEKSALKEFENVIFAL